MNQLNGKLLYAFGTSIVNGHLANKSFVEDICKSNQMQYKKFCVNGATSRTTDPNNIIVQIENAPQKVPDLIQLPMMHMPRLLMIRMYLEKLHMVIMITLIWKLIVVP